MDDQAHFLASEVLQDMKGFGWPLFAVVILRLIPSTLSGDKDGMKRALFIIEMGLVFVTFLFLISDGGDLITLARVRPLWGFTFALGLASTIAAILFNLLRSSRDAAELRQGIFEVPAVTPDARIRNPRIYGVAALFLLSASTLWLLAL